jgi:excisionase family DNA binding protein
MAKTPNNSELTHLLTIAQVAELESVSERTVRRWIKGGHLPAIRTGRMIRVCPDDLRTYRLRRLLGAD